MTLSEIDEGILAARELLAFLEQARAVLTDTGSYQQRWRDKYALDAEFDT